MLLRPGLLREAALLHAMVPFRPEVLPDLSPARVLLTGGRHDPLIPRAQTQALAQILQDAGAEVTLSWQPGGHQLTAAEVEVARTWLGGT